MENNIFKQVKEEIDFYNKQPLDCNPSYANTQPELLDLIKKYWNSKFKDKEYDDDGFKRLFFNICRFRVKIAAKATDLDVKNIRIVADDGQSYNPAWFFTKELNQWMEDNEFGVLLNKIKEKRPKFGEIVLKKVRDKITMVKLDNFMWDPTVNLEDSDFAIEKHPYTPQELRKQKKWDNIDEVIKHWRGRKKKGEYIEVYERCGEVLESEVKEGGSDEKYVLAMFIIYPFSNFKEGHILAKQKIDKISDRYKSLKWEEKEGRGMGEGLIEELFENQIAVNESSNMRHKALFWAALHLYQTKDDLIQRNLLGDSRDGDVVRSLTGIAPIINEERNLAHYANDLADWMENASQQTFTYEPISGQKLPSGTPLGSAQLQVRMGGQYFEQRLQDLGLFVKNVLWEWVFPEFKNKKKGKHILKFMGSEVELKKLDNLIIGSRIEKKIFEYLEKNKRIPTSEEVELMKSLEARKLSGTKERYLDIPDEFYENKKYKMNIIITGEQTDVAAKMATLQYVIPLVMSNPALLENPRLKGALYKLLDLAGISPIDFEGAVEEPQKLEEVMTNQLSSRRVALTTRPPSPVAGPVETKL